MKQLLLKKVPLILGLICLMLIALATAFAQPDKIVESFCQVLRDRDLTRWKEIVAPTGLTVVRIYNTNNPNRGQEIFANVSEISNNFQVVLPGELPFDLRYLFGGAIRAKSLTYLEQSFPLNSPELNRPESVRSLAQKVSVFVNQKVSSFTPVVVFAGEGFQILSESDSSNGMLSGSLAIFEQIRGRFYLKMIVDMR